MQLRCRCPPRRLRLPLRRRRLHFSPPPRPHLRWRPHPPLRRPRPVLNLYRPAVSLSLHLKIAAGLAAGGIAAPSATRMTSPKSGWRPTVTCPTISAETMPTSAMPSAGGSSLPLARLIADGDEANEAITAQGVGDGLGTYVAASLVAGVVAAVASNLVDVAKTRVMNMRVELGAALKYGGAVRRLLKEFEF